MDDINKVVKDKLEAMGKDGTIEAMIQASLETTLKSSVEEALRGYSAFGKAITAHIKETINCDMRTVKLPEYNLFISKIIVEKFTELMQTEAAAHLEKIVTEALPPIEGESKFSKILNWIDEEYGNCAREKGDRVIAVSHRFNDDDTALYVTIVSPEYEDVTKVTFYNWKHEEQDRWHIGYINHDGHAITGRPHTKAAHSTDAIADMLYRYYAMGTQFEADAEFEDICVDD